MNASDMVPRQRLSHHVLQKLLSEINTGKVSPGELMPSERQLMERFGVGRPAIREAMQDLQRMGLVHIIHGEGARVLQPTAQSMIGQISGAARMLLSSSDQNLEHLKDARVFFEVGMVRQAAVHAKVEDVEDLQRLIEEQILAYQANSGLMAADLAFHRKIAEISGNPIYAAVSEAMLAWLAEYHSGLIRKVGREVQTVAEHQQILDRIKARDVDGAAAAMMMHLTRASDLYRPNL